MRSSATQSRQLCVRREAGNSEGIQGASLEEATPVLSRQTCLGGGASIILWVPFSSTYSWDHSKTPKQTPSGLLVHIRSLEISGLSPLATTVRSRIPSLTANETL